VRNTVIESDYGREWICFNYFGSSYSNLASVRDPLWVQCFISWRTL